MVHLSSPQVEGRPGSDAGRFIDRSFARGPVQPQSAALVAPGSFAEIDGEAGGEVIHDGNDDSASLVAFYRTDEDLLRRLRGLEASGINLCFVSALRLVCRSDTEPIGFYAKGNCIRSVGRGDELWNELLGVLMGGSVVLVPEIGWLAAGGPISHLLVAASRSELGSLRFEPLTTVLQRLGVPSAPSCLLAHHIRNGQRLLIINGPNPEIRWVCEPLCDDLAEEIWTFYPNTPIPNASESSIMDELALESLAARGEAARFPSISGEI